MSKTGVSIVSIAVCFGRRSKKLAKKYTKPVSCKIPRERVYWFEISQAWQRRGLIVSIVFFPKSCIFGLKISHCYENRYIQLQIIRRGKETVSQIVNRVFFVYFSLAGESFHLQSISARQNLFLLSFNFIFIPLRSQFRILIVQNQDQRHMYRTVRNFPASVWAWR